MKTSLLFLLLILMSSLSQARFGGGNEGGGNVTADGKVLDFAEYEDLEEIKDIRTLEVFKFDPSKKEVTDNTWTKLKSFFDKEFNTAFLGYFMRLSTQRKWYFDKSDVPFAGSCINVSISGLSKTPVACQDNKEVRINKTWWYSATTSDWKRVGIIMHELFLIHARKSYQEKDKDEAEKAVRAINAKLFTAFSIFLENRPSDQLMRAEKDFLNELIARGEFFRALGYSYYGLNVPGHLQKIFSPEELELSKQIYGRDFSEGLAQAIIFGIVEPSYLFNLNNLKRHYQSIYESLNFTNRRLVACGDNYNCSSEVMLQFVQNEKERPGFSTTPVSSISPIDFYSSIFGLRSLDLVEQYCAAVANLDMNKVALVDDQYKEKFNLYDAVYLKKLTVKNPKSLILEYRDNLTYKSTQFDCNADMARAIESGELSKAIVAKIEKDVQEKPAKISALLEKIFKLSGIKTYLP